MRAETRFERRTARGRCRPRCEVLEGRGPPATFLVADVAGLRAAIGAVNANPSKFATISLAPGTYDLSAELKVVNAKGLTIQGDPSGPVVVDNPTHSDRIFEFAGGNVTIDSL